MATTKDDAEIKATLRSAKLLRQMAQPASPKGRFRTMAEHHALIDGARGLEVLAEGLRRLAARGE